MIPWALSLVLPKTRLKRATGMFIVNTLFSLLPGACISIVASASMGLQIQLP